MVARDPRAGCSPRCPPDPAFHHTSPHRALSRQYLHVPASSRLSRQSHASLDPESGSIFTLLGSIGPHSSRVFWFSGYSANPNLDVESAVRCKPLKIRCKGFTAYLRSDCIIVALPIWDDVGWWSDSLPWHLSRVSRPVVTMCDM